MESPNVSQLPGSGNGSGEGTETEPHFPGYIQATATGFCASILTFGCLGNILVPLVVCQSKELRNSTNLFLINLSVADLLVLIVCMPTVLIELHSRPEVWVLGEFMCKTVPFVELMAAHASILTILAITLERYYAICKPLRAGYTCTTMRAVAIIISAWLIAFLVTSPVVSFAEYTQALYVDGSLVPVCLTSVHRTSQKIYFILDTVVLFLLPLLVLTCLYGVIAKHLMRDRIQSSCEKSQHRTRRQVVFMLAAVVACFFFCILPFRIFIIWIVLVPQETVESLGPESYYNLLYFCRVMLYINSAANPILYNLISSKFRAGFARLLCCRPSSLRRMNTLSTTQNSFSSFKSTPLSHRKGKYFTSGKRTKESFV